MQVQAAAVTVGLALLVAGCGGSPSASKTTTGQGNTWVAFSSCMRSNGVSRYPDPVGNGAPPKKSLQQLGVSNSRFTSAESACRRLLPNGGRPPSLAQQHQVTADALQFARCVRSHGVPNFPDPDSTGRIPDPASVGINQGSPKFQAANVSCAKWRPPYMPSNAAYNAYARSHGQ